MASKQPSARKTRASAKKTVRSVEPVRTSLTPLVVGIGASAGGLEAVQRLLRALPRDTGMVFVVVQHLPADHTSLLAEILGRATKMPVTQVSDQPTVERDHVYVIPPGRSMVLRDGKLHLFRKAQVHLRSIDTFLGSLAEDQGHRAIGVVLSGTGADGTVGLREVKDAGGITFAQDASAQQHGMPDSAVQSGVVDYVMAPEGIAAELARVAKHPALLERAPEELAWQQKDFDRVLRILHDTAGVDFGQYRTKTVQRRLARRMLLQRQESLADYAKGLQQDPAEARALAQDLLIGVTSFFRDPQAFEALARRVLPALLRDRRVTDPARVWVSGCSGGEEAYSIAMAIMEHVGRPGVIPAQLFATDVSEVAIEKARAGIYPASIAADVSPERLRRFFVEVEGGYQVCKPIREMCVFARQNVLADPPFSRMDLISCRNLLIYLEPAVQRRLIPLFHYALRPGGFLWLGSSESVGASAEDLFDAVEPKLKLYSKRGDGLPAGALPAIARGAAVHDVADTRTRPARPAPHEPDVQREADRLALARYAPPGVLLDADFNVLQFRGDVGRFLAIAPGRPSVKALNLAREGLLVPLRACLQKAAREQRPAAQSGILVRANGDACTVDLYVAPLSTGEGGRSYLVSFETREPQAAPRAEPAPRRRRPPSPRAEEARHVAQLDRELQETREYLQSLVEQQEAANEELQSANEEVQSSNEELQSINEELQTSKEEIESSNEELATVNQELSDRNEQLTQLNDDLVNFLASTHLAFVQVDTRQRIRRFTPDAQHILNLIPTDVGRPIGDINPLVPLPELTAWLSEVIEGGGRKEQEVKDRSGRWYSMRLRPYRDEGGAILGASMVLVDVDAHKRAVEEIAASNRRKDEFLAMLAHELRNPLASIQSTVETMALEPFEPDSVPRKVALMKRQVLRLTRLVDDLLDVARIDEGKIEMERTRVDLAALIPPAVAAARGQPDYRGQEIDVSLPPGHVCVEGDIVRIEQVVSNLLQNAVSFTGRGDRISVSLAESRGAAELRVLDTGKGIDPELRPRIFDLFVQASPVRPASLGVGLTLVKKLVELHGGTVEAQSDGVDRGSEFVVRMPLASAGNGNPAAANGMPPAASSGAPRRILVVDDARDVAESLGELLRREGHQVTIVDSGEAALEASRVEPPDVVFLDLSMQDMDGYEVARRLRKRRANDAVLLVALSGQGRPDDRFRSREAGMDAHLVKPVTVEHLRQLLARPRQSPEESS